MSAHVLENDLKLVIIKNSIRLDFWFLLALNTRKNELKLNGNEAVDQGVVTSDILEVEGARL